MTFDDLIADERIPSIYVFIYTYGLDPDSLDSVDLSDADIRCLLRLFMIGLNHQWYALSINRSTSPLMQNKSMP